MYRCVICSYTTDNSGNYYRHIKTKKHKSKTNVKRLTCDRCSFTTKYASSLSRHKKRCNGNQITSIVSTLNNKIDKLEIENRYLKEINHKDSIVNSQLSVIKDIVMNNKTKSLPKLLNEHYKDNPHIERIDCSIFDEYIKPKSKLIEEMLSEFRHKTLGRMLSDFILTLYKKEDTSTQSVFSTDISRTNYIIKELFTESKSEWILDKKGVKTTSYIIDPLLNHIKKILVEFINSYDFSTDVATIEKTTRKKREALDIISYIDDGKLEKDVNKRLCPQLKIDNNFKKLRGEKFPELY